MHWQHSVENTVVKNLQGLLAFVEAASAGSLRAAADRLDVTPAAVSKNLARLEQQLGVRLLQRSTRRLALTAEGAVFLEKARAALRGLDEAVAEVSQSAQVPAGRVRISVGMAFGRRWVLPLLPKLAIQYPGLVLEVDLDNRPVDLLSAGFDIGIRGGFVPDSSLIARRVCALPVGLFASPGYLKRAGVPTNVADLAGHRTAAVRFANGALSSWMFGRGAGALEITPNASVLVSDPEVALDLALDDAGIVQAGLHHALPYLRSGRLKLLLPGLHDPGAREVVLHYPHRLYLAPRVRVVVDALLAHFKASADLHTTLAEIAEILPQCVAQPPAAAAGLHRDSTSSAAAHKRPVRGLARKPPVATGS
jgi:DNA-binding transcriptional LysR family regulator